MGIFGWSYPPGCHSVPGDEPEQPCIVCGGSSDTCICPECPECLEIGNPYCYNDSTQAMKEEAKNWVGWEHESHGLKMTTKQKIGRAKLDIAVLQGQIDDIGQYIYWLETKEE